MKSLAWSLFRKTGKIGYYLLAKELDKWKRSDINDKEGSRYCY
jgi:hypothetical protein